MNVIIVPQEHRHIIFPKVKHYLEKAAVLSGGRMSIEEIENNVLHKNHQLWIAFNEDEIVATADTELIQYAKIKTLVGHFIGGKDLESWKQPIVDAMAMFGKAEGCSRIEFMGRRGWTKPLKQIGWKETYRVYEYNLET
jgi:hypothetical protein